MVIGTLRRRLASSSNAARIRFCSSGVRDPSPSSNMQILKRLTPDSRARRLCETPSAER